MEKGYIHLYHGTGKGKTTAAIGLAVRAAGAGEQVVFSQFLKGRDTSELNSLGQLSNVTIIRNQKDYGFYFQMTEEQKLELRIMHDETLAQIKEMISKKRCDVLILDEITYAYNWNLIDRSVLEDLLQNKPEGLEIVMTGRDPDEFLLNISDYVSEVKCIKHPFERNIPARKGIEF